MTTAAVTPPIAINKITNVLNVFVFGLIHSVEILDELVAFCTSAVEKIVLVELIELGTIGRSRSK